MQPRTGEKAWRLAAASGVSSEENLGYVVYGIPLGRKLGWTFSGLRQDSLVRSWNFEHYLARTFIRLECYRARTFIGLGTSSEPRTSSGPELLGILSRKTLLRIGITCRWTLAWRQDLGFSTRSEPYRAWNFMELRTFSELGTFTVTGLSDELSLEPWITRWTFTGTQDCHFIDWFLDPELRTGYWPRVLFYGYTLCLVGGHQDILFVFVCGSWLLTPLGAWGKVS